MATNLISIVPYSKEYAKQVRDIWVSKTVWANTAISSDLSVEEANQKLSQERIVSFVALENKVVVGAARLSLGRGRKSHCAEFVLFVDEKKRNKGIGAMLMDALIAAAKKNKITRLELSFFADNDAARKLYTKYGFVPEGIKVKGISRGKDLIDEVLMVKFL